MLAGILGRQTHQYSIMHHFWGAAIKQVECPTFVMQLIISTVAINKMVCKCVMFISQWLQESVIKWVIWISQSVSQLVRQTGRQGRLSVSQSVCQSVSQPVCQSVNQSVSQSVNESVSQSVSQSMSQSVSQSVSQPVCQSVIDSDVPSVS